MPSSELVLTGHHHDFFVVARYGRLQTSESRDGGRRAFVSARGPFGWHELAFSTRKVRDSGSDNALTLRSAWHSPRWRYQKLKVS